MDIRRIYTLLRIILSEKNKGRLSSIIIKSGLKPTVNTKVNSIFNKGIVVFSADFEMAWAYRYSRTSSQKAIEVGLKERGNVPALLNLFDLYLIPVTWATVGHLFLSKCSKGNNNFPHSEMPRPAFFENKNWSFQSGDWYCHDPCTDIFTDPAWYAADLIYQIQTAKINHEIGCHTFSHLDFSYKNCPENLAVAELDACKNLASDKNIILRSMVFPGGTYGNYESLKEKGFLCYRKPMEYHIDLPVIDSFGLVSIPSSLCLDKDNYGWSKKFHLEMVEKYLHKTAKYKLICHFWFHPCMDKWYIDNVMPDVLKLVYEYRSSDKVQVKTMGDLAEEFNKITTNKNEKN